MFLSKIKNVFKRFLGGKYLNIMLLPDGKTGIRFKISLRLAYLFGCFFVLFLLVLFFLVLSYGRVSYKSLQARSLALENKRLSDYNAKVLELEKQIWAYRNFIQRISELAGIEYPAEDEKRKDYQMDLRAVSEEAGSFNADPFLFRLQKPYIDFFLEDFIPRGLPVEGWITKEFEEDSERLVVEHPGVDIACKEGTEVKATAWGWVKFSGWDPVYGNLIILEHKEGYSTCYGHNFKVLAKEGEFVERGKVIALSGNTGRSSAPHLHYEIREDGVPVDPKNFLTLREKDEK